MNGVRARVATMMAAVLVVLMPGPAMAGPTTSAASAALNGSALTRFPGFAALPDSAGLTAPALLRGQLQDLAGSAVPGAQVLVAAWPSPEAIRALPVGGSFGVVPLARTTTGRDGSYVLRSLLTPALAALTGPDGLDIEINVFHEDRHFVYMSQVRPDLDAGAWGGAVVAGTVAPALSSVAGSLDIALDSAHGEPLKAGLPISWPPPTAPDEPPFQKRERPISVGCTNYRLVGEEKKVWTTVATAVARNGAGMKVDYDSGSRTASSTGFSFGGATGFAINGGRERTLTVGGEFWDRTSKRGGVVAREYRTVVEHLTVRRVCKGEREGEYRAHYQTFPSSLTGGGGSVPIPEPWTCRRENSAPASDHKSVYTLDHRAATYGAAFTFSPLGGRSSFTGAAQSGYSKTVKITYTFERGYTGFWCGHTAKPASDGQMVQAFAR